jgi:hypothetical protein
MKGPPGKTVRIVKADQRPRLSKGQEAFNALITLIDKKRALLAAWEAAIPPYQQKYTTQLVPLMDTMAGLIKARRPSTLPLDTFRFLYDMQVRPGRRGMRQGCLAIGNVLV